MRAVAMAMAQPGLVPVALPQAGMLPLAVGMQPGMRPQRAASPFYMRPPPLHDQGQAHASAAPGAGAPGQAPPRRGRVSSGMPTVILVLCSPVPFGCHSHHVQATDSICLPWQSSSHICLQRSFPQLSINAMSGQGSLQSLLQLSHMINTLDS